MQFNNKKKHFTIKAPDNSIGYNHGLACSTIQNFRILTGFSTNQRTLYGLASSDLIGQVVPSESVCSQSQRRVAGDWRTQAKYAAGY